MSTPDILTANEEVVTHYAGPSMQTGADEDDDVALVEALNRVDNGDHLITFIDALDTFPSAPSVSLTYNRIIKLLHMRGVVAGHLHHWGNLRSAQKAAIRQVICRIGNIADVEGGITIGELKQVALRKDASKFYSDVRRAVRTAGTKKSQRERLSVEPDGIADMQGLTDEDAAVADETELLLQQATKKLETQLSSLPTVDSSVNKKPRRTSSPSQKKIFTNSGDVNSDSVDNFSGEISYAKFLSSKAERDRRESRVTNLKDIMANENIYNNVLSEEDRTLIKSELHNLVTEK